MKTTFRLIGAVATAAALFSSCKKEAFNEEVKPGTVEMTIIAGADDATRTVLGSDGAVTWSAKGETLKVLENNGASNLSSYTSEEGVSNDERKTMSFAVSLDSKTAETFDYFALYPSTSFVEDTYSDAKRVKVILPAQQSPSATSFDPTSDILVSKPVLGLAKQPKSLKLQFARVVAIGKMNITKLNTEEKVKKVSFTATGKVVNGRSYINLEDASAVQYGYYAPSATVTLDYTEQSIAANEMTAYFTCWPFELAAGETFSVVVETENYIFTKDVTLAKGRSLAFKVGRASEFNVSFSGIKGVEKAPATQLVPDGAYVVAYENNMMTVGTTSNKYRDVATLPTANADNSYLVDATAAWNFVYNSENETYSIQSVSESKYLNWTSSTSLTLNSTTPTNYSITKNEDGTYKIGSTSNSDTRYIGYNNTNPRFAMYLSGQKDQIINLNLYPAKVVKLAEISVQETLSLPAELAEGEIPVSWKNVDMSLVSVDVYQDADCTIREKNWISVEFNADKTAIAYTVLDNDTKTERKAYIKVKAISEDGESADSKVITVTQANAGSTTDWSKTYTSNVGISGAKVKINNVEYDAIQVGASKNAGSKTFKVPANTTKLYLHVVGWKGEDGKTHTIRTNVGTISSSSITTKTDSGVNNKSPFTLSSNDYSSSDYFYEFKLSGVTSEATITISNSDKNSRGVYFGINAE